MDGIFLWGGLRRTKKQTICILQQSRTPTEFYYHSDQPLGFVKKKKKRGPLNITLRHHCPGELFFFPSEGKRYWLASPTGTLKNALYKSLTVMNLFPVGMDVSNIWGLWTTGSWRTTVLFTAQRAWNNFSHFPFGFCSDKMKCYRTRDNEALSLYSFYCGLYAFKSFL